MLSAKRQYLCLLLNCWEKSDSKYSVDADILREEASATSTAVTDVLKLFSALLGQSTHDAKARGT